MDKDMAELLAEMAESRGLLTAPANLKAEILEKSRQIDVQIAAGAHTNQASPALCPHGNTNKTPPALRLHGNANKTSLLPGLQESLLNRRLALLLYGIKIGAAVVCSIGLILWTPYCGWQARPDKLLHQKLMNLSQTASSIIQETIQVEVSDHD